MIKLANSDGEIVFILEPGNVTKMQMGEPLSINLKELGIPGEVKIYWTPDIIRMAMEIAVEKETHKCISSDWLDKRIQDSLECRVIDRVAS